MTNDNTQTTAEQNTNTVLLLVPITIVIITAAAVPFWLVWTSAPVIDPDLDFYIRLAAAMISAIVGGFLGAFVLQMAVRITRDLTD